MNYDAFLSFSTNPDYKLSQKIESFLETFHQLKTPRGIQLNKLEICRDGSDFSLHNYSNSNNKNEVIKRMIETYLTKSKYLVVLCSSKTPTSEYVKFETEWFLKNKGSENILLAISEGDDPIQNSKEIFPEIVIQNQLHLRPFYDFRGYKKKQVKHWQKIRDFEEELTNLAAHLHGDSSGQLMPLWHREKLRKLRNQHLVVSIVASFFYHYSGYRNLAVL